MPYANPPMTMITLSRENRIKNKLNVPKKQHLKVSAEIKYCNSEMANNLFLLTNVQLQYELAWINSLNSEFFKDQRTVVLILLTIISSIPAEHKRVSNERTWTIKIFQLLNNVIECKILLIDLIIILSQTPSLLLTKKGLKFQSHPYSTKSSLNTLLIPLARSTPPQFHPQLLQN